MPSIAAVQPLHVAAWIEQQTREHAAPTVTARLTVLRHLFDWLVTGQVVQVNPAGLVHGPPYVVKAGKTTVLSPKEARADRQHRHAGGPERPGADRVDGVQLRENRCGADDEGGGCLRRNGAGRQRLLTPSPAIVGLKTFEIGLQSSSAAPQET